MGCRAATSNNTVLAISLNGYVNGVTFKQYCTEHCININDKTKQVQKLFFCEGLISFALVCDLLRKFDRWCLRSYSDSVLIPTW